jgi:DNA-binding LytR/AlgR family response regulator
MALRILNDAGSTTAAFHNQQARDNLVRHHHKPLAILKRSIHYVAILKLQNNGQTIPRAPTRAATKPSKAVVIVSVRSILYLHIHTHIIEIHSSPPKRLCKQRHDQSFVRPSSLIPLLILGDVGLCGPTLTTLAAPRSAVAAVLIALTAT